jgi:hypothetical protein
MADFPDKKEVDATRKWYYGIGYDLLAVGASIFLVIASVIYILWR